MLPRHRKKMSKAEKFVLGGLCLIAFLGIAIGTAINIVWFKINPEPRFLPLESQIPQNEILFTLDKNRAPVDRIGFINLDGKELESRSYEIPVPLFFQEIPIKQYDNSAGRIFTWSLDGQSVGGINPTWGYNGQGYPVIIENDGKIVFCEPSESIIALNSILIISPNMVMAIEIYEHDEKKQNLVIYDMKSCQLARVLYTSEENENMYTFAYNKNGLLALETYSPSFSGVRIYDDGMKSVMEIDGAKWPAFSKDGLKIAYINDSGKLCINSIIEDSQPICFGNADKGVSWSPDSEWLVFSDSSNHVTKLEISTGQETIIGDGYWPDWRPSNSGD